MINENWLSGSADRARQARRGHGFHTEPFSHDPAHIINSLNTEGEVVDRLLSCSRNIAQSSVHSWKKSEEPHNMRMRENGEDGKNLKRKENKYNLRILCLFVEIIQK